MQSLKGKFYHGSLMTHFSKLFNTVYQKELKIKKKREREMKKWNFQVSEFLTY